MRRSARPEPSGATGCPAIRPAWCLKLPQDMLLDLLASLAALTVDASEMTGKPRNAAADSLAQALALDMLAWWRPSVDGFWQRLPKAGMIHAMGEAQVTASGPLDSVKKPAAAQMVAKAMRGSGWLPVCSCAP